MDIDVLGLLAAAAGGFLGATFGALIAFVFVGLAVLVGVAVLIGTGDASFLGSVAFGSFLGPHVSFAAGVGAVAYAARRGYHDSGRDVVTPLVSLARPDVLLVGAAFGVFGYLCQGIIAVVPWLGSHTDRIALAVLVSALVARLAFGRSGLVGANSLGHTGWRRFAPNDTQAWLRYQERPAMVVLLGTFLGAVSASLAVTLLSAYPGATGVIYVGFAISAVSLAFLGVGVAMPVTHHITLVSAVAVAAVVARWSLLPAPVLILIGAGVGAITALVCEGFSRLWLIRGDTHIDPPAAAIWPMTTLSLVVVELLP
ncbi:MAG: hypothetical protein AAGC63_03980 [Propionicimonas sp.]|nr:hypothetical protein [Propionicimonas sp.]